MIYIFLALALGSVLLEVPIYELVGWGPVAPVGNVLPLPVEMSIIPTE